MDNTLLVQWFNQQKEMIGSMLVLTYQNAATGYQNQARDLSIRRDDSLLQLERSLSEHVYEDGRFELRVLPVRDETEKKASCGWIYLVAQETVQRRRQEIIDRFDHQIVDLLRLRNAAEVDGFRVMDQYRPLFRRQATPGDIDHIQAIAAICGIDLNESLRKNVVAVKA